MKKTKIFGMLLGLLLLTVSVHAAELEITADELAYDSQHDMATATGHVVIIRENARMTGAVGEYHFNDRTAVLRGGVTYHRDTVSLQAAEVRALVSGIVEASGGVSIQDGTRNLSGSVVTYEPNTGHGTINGNAQVEMDGIRMTASDIDAYTNEIRLVGTGGVTLYNAENQMDAVSDRAVYTQTPGQEDGYVVMEGNARVTQDGNVLTGPRLDIRVSERSVETKGRSTLVIQTRE